MPEILWTWLHRELRSCDSGEAITPGPEPDPDPQVSSVADSCGPPWSSPRLRPPPCPNPCPAVNETRLSSTRAWGQEGVSPFWVGAGWAALGVLGDGVTGDLLPFPLASPSPAPGAHPVLWSPSRFPQVSLHQHQQCCAASPVQWWWGHAATQLAVMTLLPRWASSMPNECCTKQEGPSSFPFYY